MKTVNTSGITFSETKGEIPGFASGWFFWVNESFKPALDINFAEAIEPNKTKELRDSLASKLGYASLVAMQDAIKADGKLLGKSAAYRSVISRAVRVATESQGEPPAYAFRENDGLESRCGRWYVQVTTARPDKRARQGAVEITSGFVGVQLYRKCLQDGEPQWKKHAWASMSQFEFVEIIRAGRSSPWNLGEDVRETDGNVATPDAQAELF